MPVPRASLCTSLVFLKIPACLYNSTMHSDAFFISLINFASAFTHYSTSHLIHCFRLLLLLCFPKE